MEKTALFRPAHAAVLLTLCLTAAATGTAAQQVAEAEVEDPQASRPRLVVAVEDQPSVIVELPAGAGNLQGAQALPRHGYVVPGSGSLTYYLDPGYFGRDSMALVVDGRDFAVELLILPRLIPFAGRFDASYQAAALWDNASRSFFICGRPAEGSQDLPCRHLPVAGLAAGGYIPIAWPDPQGKELPVLFDPAGSRFIQLEGSRDAFAVYEYLEVPGFEGAWPILGDWNGEGIRRLAMVMADGRIFQLGVKGWSEWNLGFGSSDALTLPILLDGSGNDGIALANPQTGDLEIRKLDPAGAAVASAESSFLGGDCRRPMSWMMSPLSGAPPSQEVFYLRFGGASGFDLWLEPGRYQSSKPTTIPVKFPDDPPLGGGGG